MTILEQAGDLDAFRSAVRDWVQRASPANWRAEVLEQGEARFVAIQRAWMVARAEVGLATPHFPGEYGHGLGLAHQVIIADELARADAPPLPAFSVSLNHIPATLGRWGSEAQQRRYLPGVARGEIWCQGFSEPSAGSDLASLKTKAVREGDDYVVNGQKIWSSYAAHAQFCILLARTDATGRKHEGISFFLMDMQTPGVEPRRIRQATGKADFCELFLTDVRIPAENLIGAEGQGWAVAQTTLASERGVFAFEGTERLHHAFEAFLRKSFVERAPWTLDDQLRREVIAVVAETQALRRLIRRLLRTEGDQAQVALLSAIVKLSATDARQRLYDLAVRLAGPEAQAHVAAQLDTFDNPVFAYVNSFAGTISGGSNEIMRNIIAERGLGLPREPSGANKVQ